MPGPTRRRWQLAVAAVCVLGGVLFGTAHRYADGRDIRPRNVELSQLIAAAQAKVAVAATTAEQLQDQIGAAAGQDVSPLASAALHSAAAQEAASGMTPLTGPGVVVTLTDAPRDANGAYPADANPDDLVVHQQDVQAVVNALWAGGAEAMTIMDQRVIATSAVRCIGNTLLLQGRAYSPPFTVAAIGPADGMTAALDAQPGVALFRRYVDEFDLGYDVQVEPEVTAPGYQGVVLVTAAEQPR